MSEFHCSIKRRRSYYSVHFLSSRVEETGSTNKIEIAEIFKGFIVLLLGSVVISASVMNKLTIVSLADALRHYSTNRSSNDSSNNDKLYRDEQKVAVLYWQLLIILLIPNVLTFLRCLFFGVLGKTTENYPWPRFWILVSSKEHYYNYS